MKYTSMITGALVAVLVFVAIFPAAAIAQSFNYQPRTQSEMIAYLYGRIAQLMEIKAMLEGGTGNTGNSTGVSFNLVKNDTYSALEVTDVTAVLRGEVVLYGKATAKAWFEYGQDEDFLDQKTNQVSVRSAYDRAVRVKISSLEPDERYYFRIVTQSNDGSISYGPVYGFRTDETED